MFVWRMLITGIAAASLLSGAVEAQVQTLPPGSPPIGCGNLELSLKTTAPVAAKQTAYDRVLRGHVYEFVDGEPVDTFDEGKRVNRTAMQRAEIAYGLKSYFANHSHSTTSHPTIVIHFHGGLVDRCSGYSGAAGLAGVYDTADAYPIFPIYNVGPGESIDKGWSGASARDPQYGGDGRAMSATARFWYGRGLLTEPVEDLRSVAVIPRLEQLAAERAMRVKGRRTHEDDFSNGVLTNREEQLRKGIWPGFNEGHMTGGRAWSYMKWVIDRSLALDSNEGWTPDRERISMLALMDEIHALTKTKPSTVVLVGHSTGAIYAAKFLRAWKRSASEYWHDPQAEKQDFSLVLLAPAVRYDDFYKALADAGDMLHGHVRTFTMYDGAERDSFDGPFPGFRTRYYRLSLLYAISGLFESWPDAPILGLQRFACPPFYGRQVDGTNDYTTDIAKVDSTHLLAFDPSRFNPPQSHPLRKAELAKVGSNVMSDLDYVRLVDDWFLKNNVAHAFAFSPSPAASLTPVGMRSGAIAHGDFPRDFLTMSSVVALIKASSQVPNNDEAWTAAGATNDNCTTTRLL